MDEYKNLLIIYSNYLALSKLFPLYLLNLERAEEEIDNLEEQRDLCIVGLTTCQEDRDFIYDYNEEQLESFKDRDKKNKLKLILISAGTGLVGVAVGILIGVFGI